MHTMDQPTIHVVVNLDQERVSWVNAFMRNAKGQTLTCGPTVAPNADFNLFLGDNIPWDSIDTGETNVIYFLAATALNPALPANRVLQSIELENISRAAMTLVPSHSERGLVALAAPGIDLKKIQVVGFPVNTNQPIGPGAAEQPSVCLISDLSPVKNPEFEVRLVDYLQAKGFVVGHFLTTANPPKSLVQQLSCTVYERMPHQQYIEALGQYDYYISVSHYESLCVSGIEAALAGCIPLCPSHSGFLDWCPASNRFRSTDCNAIFDRLQRAHPLERGHLERYGIEAFYGRLVRLLINVPIKQHAV